MNVIDINCDLGEGVGNEAVVMPLISSCNIACGGHAGDFDTMRSVVELAGVYGVRIGAHPSFPDVKNFGRVVVNMSSSDLYESIKFQIESLKSVAEAQQLKMHHVKPHGALYNLASVNVEVAATVVDVVKSVDPQLILYVPFGSVISKIAMKQGLKIMYEAFADRNYNADLTLVSRRESDALIYDKEAIFKHVFNMIYYGNVTTKNGVEVALRVDTICVHGDSENVIENLLYVRRKLDENNINIS
ncbi:5-oxoprolinase subunit PxpA [Psychroserpens damuponensis]|uniref:5-oxoprolinase subunit PxpA n=1 Tax=Psychroserpens damuponensis TaxID=943936 RepID=UPI00058CE73A|nr:5-oxoprolinase subunit PxpA [Psychroserpens damuponensis]